MNAQELDSNLAYFTGTMTYHRFSSLFPNIVLTDGAKYLADKADAYWLMDAIASHQTDPKVRREDFQVWRLSVSNNKAVLVGDDGNDNILTKQRIKYTDFPLASIKLYMVNGGGFWVIMLAGEY